MPLPRLRVPQPIAVSILPMTWGSTAATALLVPGLDVGRNEHWLRPRLLKNQAQRGAAVFLLWLAQRHQTKYLGAGSPGYPAETSDLNNSISSGRRRVQRDAEEYLSSRRERGTSSELLNSTSCLECGLLVAARPPRDQPMTKMRYPIWMADLQRLSGVDVYM